MVDLCLILYILGILKRIVIVQPNHTNEKCRQENFGQISLSIIIHLVIQKGINGIDCYTNEVIR